MQHSAKISEKTRTFHKSCLNAEVDLKGVAVVLDLPQPLDVLWWQPVLDGALDDHTRVGVARQALLGDWPHPLLAPDVCVNLDRRVRLDSRNLQE